MLDRFVYFVPSGTFAAYITYLYLFRNLQLVFLHPKISGPSAPGAYVLVHMCVLIWYCLIFVVTTTGLILTGTYSFAVHRLARRSREYWEEGREKESQEKKEVAEEK